MSMYQVQFLNLMFSSIIRRKIYKLVYFLTLNCNDIIIAGVEILKNNYVRAFGNCFELELELEIEMFFL